VNPPPSSAGPSTWPYGAAVAKRGPLLPHFARWAGLVLLLALGLAGITVLVLLGGGFHYRELAAVRLPDGTHLQQPLPRSTLATGAAQVAAIERRIARQAPPGVYITVDTIANRLYLKHGSETLMEATCSTGTGGILVDPGSGRRWVFETPRGSYKVLGKTRHPVWHKPDWAFVEEGQPIPTNPAERQDDFSLGSYALDLGDGYLIHGTLYERLLGRSTTHGCIRLGDRDLERLFNTVEVGTSVFIY
jgi:lipoprotein-anchoring transpeptidase ErfK/SrfK